MIRLTAPFLAAAPAAFGADETFQANGIVLVLRTFLALAAVIALVWGSLWLLKRFTGGRKGDSGAIRIAGTAHLGAKQRIVLIDVEGRRMVLGVADPSITLLADLGKTPKAKTKSKSIADQTRTMTFADFLGSFYKRRTDASV
jgi:flagellar protein FliO/FliZ